MGAPYALSSDLVSAWPAKSLEVAQYIDGQLPLIAMTQNAQTGTTYTLAATDFTKLVTLSNASPVTVTVPLESSVAWVAGTQLRLMNLGAGVVTVAGAVGVTINGSPLTLAQYPQGTMTKTGTNIWTFVGSPSAPGMDLITPTSVAGSGVTLSGGLVTIAAATTASVNGCFTSAYDVYRIVWTLTPTANVDQSIRFRAAGSDISSNNYSWASGDGTALTTGASAGILNTTTGVTTVPGFGSQDIYGPALTQITQYAGLSNYNTTSKAYFGRFMLTTTFDGFSVFVASGSITGSLRIYGLRN